MHEELEQDVVIWYRPRIRVWLDKRGELHIAGEADGFQKVLGAIRMVARGAEDSASVELRTEPIEKKRNPVADRGVKNMFATLTVHRDRASSQVRASMTGTKLALSFNEVSKAVLGFAVVEALDGEGDFSIAIALDGAPSRLWFWGYSNSHGVNSF